MDERWRREKDGDCNILGGWVIKVLFSGHFRRPTLAFLLLRKPNLFRVLQLKRLQCNFSLRLYHLLTFDLWLFRSNTITLSMSAFFPFFLQQIPFFFLSIFFICFLASVPVKLLTLILVNIFSIYPFILYWDQPFAYVCNLHLFVAGLSNNNFTGQCLDTYLPCSFVDASHYLTVYWFLIFS